MCTVNDTEIWLYQGQIKSMGLLLQQMERSPPSMNFLLGRTSEYCRVMRVPWLRCMTDTMLSKDQLTLSINGIDVTDGRQSFKHSHC
jgi:hypothetical protein